jgi:hypothetical protein
MYIEFLIESSHVGIENSVVLWYLIPSPEEPAIDNIALLLYDNYLTSLP